MSLHTWLSSNPFLPTSAESAVTESTLAWQTIQQNPRSIVFKTASGVELAAQTVRIDSDNRPNMMESASGIAPKRKLVVFGVRNHPTVANTDIKKGYTFSLPESNTDRYVVLDVILLPGEIQATVEVTR